VYDSLIHYPIVFRIYDILFYYPICLDTGRSKEVCCKAVGLGTKHSHLLAVQNADVNRSICLCWKPPHRQDPVKCYENPDLQQKLIMNYLKDIFRQVDISSDGSLESCLCKEICGFEDSNYRSKLK
jgi:hypothetical protein